jgi:neutral ceramidase
MTYLVGRGRSDVTGEIAGCGMLGYGKASQISAGIHTRLRARAFVFVDTAVDERIVLCVAELPLMFDGVRRAVLSRLASRYGALYTERNVMLTVTHTHCGPGGYADQRLYNLTTHGFHSLTFDAIVDGITEAIDRAHADVRPSELSLAVSDLHGASVNRSPQAFARNPVSDRECFPDGVDPASTTLRIERDGCLVGAINWFATHGTSLTNRNRLVSADNKGYAAYRWERLDNQVDYLDPDGPDFVAAFAQTNSGDMSPNLDRPGVRSNHLGGPTDDQFANARIIGERQAVAASAGEGQPRRRVDGGLDARLTHVDLADVVVRAEFTGDGQVHCTSGPTGGAASIAGTDEGDGFAGFRQGANPVLDAVSRAIFRCSPRQRDSQAPKAMVLPGRSLNRIAPFVQQRVPVQLLRIGPLYLIGIPGEVTITAGLRMRRAVAAAVGTGLADVLVAGYSNAYIHYVTTPEEYDAQRYEGGSTLFGRWEAPALTQIAVGLAAAMRDGRPTESADPGPGASLPRRVRRARRLDRAPTGRAFGDVIAAPLASYRPGERVLVRFVGAHLANDLRRGGTYLEVEHEIDRNWVRIADDGDWSTALAWSQSRRGESFVTVTWDIPSDAALGRYRLRHHGDAIDHTGRRTPFVGTTEAFVVASPATSAV